MIAMINNTPRPMVNSATPILYLPLQVPGRDSPSGHSNRYAQLLTGPGPVTAPVARQPVLTSSLLLQTGRSRTCLVQLTNSPRLSCSGPVRDRPFQVKASALLQQLPRITQGDQRPPASQVESGARPRITFRRLRQLPVRLKRIPMEIFQFLQQERG